MNLQEVKENDSSMEENNNFSIGAEYKSSIGEEYMYLFNRNRTYTSSIKAEHESLQ